MATKAQKRLAGEAKQAANREESRQIGLEALERDRQQREEKRQAELREKNRPTTASVMRAMAEGLV